MITNILNEIDEIEKKKKNETNINDMIRIILKKY